MGQYRVFFTTRAGRILSSRVVEATTDAEVAEIVRRMERGWQGAEIWDGVRKLPQAFPARTVDL